MTEDAERIVCERCCQPRPASCYRRLKGIRFRACNRCLYRHDDEVNIRERMQLLDQMESNQTRPAVDRLTDAEIVILRALSIGMSTKRIAGLFGVSISTVETQRERVMTKTGATNVAHLCYVAGKYWANDGFEKLLLTKRESCPQNLGTSP